MTKPTQTAVGVSNSAKTICVSHFYKTAIEHVFDAWINPLSLEKWFGPPGFRAEIVHHDLRVGGDWRFIMKASGSDDFHHFGTYIEIRAPHKLVFTWASEEQVDGWRDENGEPTLVTVEFVQQAGGVLVTITHQQLQSDEARQALIGGWSGCLESCDRFLTLLENK